MKDLSQSHQVVDWQQPTATEVILQQLKQFADQNIRYGVDKILGFPGTTPHQISLDVFNEHLLMHANNIGMHTSTSSDASSEIGFTGTQEAERQVISMCADLMGATLTEVDGYIASGGTEANIVGCWMGRNAVRGGDSAIIYSHAAHYTIPKAVNLLNINQHRIVGTDDQGRMLTEQLDKVLGQLIQEGVANVIVVATAGTTMLGSIDDVPTISNIVGKHRKTTNKTKVHLHVDAAFGGFVVPFIPNAYHVGFKNADVDSLTMDAHKMGFTPYGSGILLARKGLFKQVETIAPYVPGNDTTLTGSRAGVNALCCWAVMKKFGKSGYANSTAKLLSMTEQVRNKFKSLGLEIFDSDMNIVAVKEQFPNSLVESGFITHSQNDFPKNLENPINGESQSIWNVVVMPHTSSELVEELLKAIS